MKTYQKMIFTWMLTGSFAASILNCTNPMIECRGHFNVSSSFTSEERDNVYNSMNRWNSFSGGKTVLTLNDGELDNCNISPIEFNSKTYIDHQKIYGDFYGVTIGGDEILIVRWDEMKNKDAFQSVLLHEIGHSFGLGHVKTDAIMGTGRIIFDFQPDDLIECQRVNACY